MSKGGRLRGQRASLPRFRSASDAIRDLALRRGRAGIEIAVMPAACLAGEVADMRRRTHDGLIRMLGRRRRSGIWWHAVHGADECRTTLAGFYPPAEQDAEATRHLAQFYSYFDEHGDQAVLVVALCEAMTSLA